MPMMPKLNSVCPFVIKEFGLGEDDSLLFDTKSVITLTDGPSEKLDVSVSFAATDDVAEINSKRLIKVELSFYNNLHQISQYYTYEVAMQFFLFHGDGFTHEHFYVQREPRLGKNLTFKTLKLNAEHVLGSTNKCSGKRRVLHICCEVRRWGSFGWIKRVARTDDEMAGMYLKNSTQGDVLMLVGGRSFQAHRHFLSNKSLVFKKMLDAQDVSEKGRLIIRIDDFDAEVVDEMLTFVYTGKSDNVSKMPVDLFKIANSYGLQRLQDICEEHLLINIDPQNVIYLLQLSDKFGLKYSQECALKFIVANKKQMAKNQEFLQFLLDDLTVDAVIDIFESLNRLQSVRPATIQDTK